MIRPWSVLSALVLAIPPAFAQSLAPHSLLHRATSPVREAGVFHFGLGTWTRRSDATNASTWDVIYANTCPVDYYGSLFQNEYYGDEGRVPGPHGPVLCDTARLSTNAGCACSYVVSAFEIGYCTGLPHSIDLKIGFQSAYVACAVPATQHSFTLIGLPGAGSMPQGCWHVTIDLEAASQTFTLSADGASCTWLPSGDLATNHLFGWTIENLTPVHGSGTSYVGALFGTPGFPTTPTPTCSMVDGTRWDTLTCPGQGGGTAHWPNNLTEPGWGMDTQDRWRDDTTTGGPIGPPCGPGCYYFGSPPTSFYLRLFSNTGCPVPEPGIAACRPQLDFANNCPCSPPNNPTTPGAGCNGLSPGNVPTGGAKMTSAGTASVSGTNPGVDTLQFTVDGLPTAASESCFLLQGPTLQAPVTFGQGLRCVAGALKRLQIHTPSPGTSTWPAAGDFQPTIQARSAQLGDPLSPGSVRHYFVQYRQSLFNAGCAFPNNFTASNAETIHWSP